MFQGLRTVIYHVPDVAAARDWYTRLLGFGPYFDQPDYVGFNVGGYELGLHPRGAGVVPGQATVAYWGVPDCRAAWDRVRELGAQPDHEPQDVGEGIIVASVVDPYGNLFGLIENPNFRLPDAVMG